MNKFAAVVLVGPKEVEIKRLGHLLEALFFYEPGVRYVVLVDDAPRRRALETVVRVPATCRVVSLPAPPSKRKLRPGALSLGAALLTGLDYLADAKDIDFVIKLDTDALVIDPFADKLAAFFTSRPCAGMVGAYRMTPNGEERGFARWGARWGERIERMSRMLQLSYTWPRQVHLALAWQGPRARIRQHVRAALERGYEPGEHCLGGAYALSMELLREMRTRDYLHAALWRGQSIAEDVMMGMYTRACGLELADLVHRGAPFGIRYRGLADSPEQLVARGFSIIHSLKNDQHLSEDELYAFFRRRRKASGAWEHEDLSLPLHPPA